MTEEIPHEHNDSLNNVINFWLTDWTASTSTMWHVEIQMVKKEDAKFGFQGLDIKK